MKKTIITMLMIIMLIICTTVDAQDPAIKLSRGLVNVLTGWIELPRNIYNTSVEENILSGLTIGIAKGIGMAIVRTGCGIYEVVTFPFPIPEDYIPILEPQFVFNKEIINEKI